MTKLTIGLIGYGNVGSGIIKLIQKRFSFIKEKFHTELIIKTICDRSIQQKITPDLKNIHCTSDIQGVLSDPQIQAVIELIGGLNPAREIALGALKNGKHLVTANKELLAHHGRELFRQAHQSNRSIYFESAVMAGVPVIKTISEGLVGNTFRALYGIINGTCNFILDSMTKNHLTFQQALEEAQKRGYAESNPTLDINGMDTAHKLTILVYLALGKTVKLEDIYTEGINTISQEDINYAQELNLTIKLLGIAKREGQEIEVRVHPTLIAKDHPLAAIGSVYNALYLKTSPLGNVLISGEGAGQMSAASGVLSDLINLAQQKENTEASWLRNPYEDTSLMTIRKMDQVKSRYYLRMTAIDKPKVLSIMAGILGKYGISINSVTQKAHNPAAHVPVVMLTDFAVEKMVRKALEKIHQLSVVKSMPIAIRMERLE